ncbi:MAG: hypothetical protein CFE21_08930 [Bacteroidetes bacterium B1(2017)]|nr:MAG: hypothetical protein CFE21_08930 [Bacteroidetes bacterium B1(2017)]
MKYIYFILFLLLFTSSSNIQAQSRPNQRTIVAAPPQPAKPKGPSPYVLKKDYDSSMTKVNGQLRNIQSTVNAVKSTVSSKDAELKTIHEQMKQVEEVLNSTNFKMSITSDSLSKTQLTVEEIQKANEIRFETLENEAKSLGTTTKILWALVLLAIAACAGVYVVLSKKLEQFKGVSKINLAELQATVHENQSASQTKADSLSHQIITESRSNHHFAERMGASIKEELATVKADLDKANSTIGILTNELNELNERTKPKG